jgi:hypothetical protein
MATAGSLISTLRRDPVFPKGLKTAWMKPKLITITGKICGTALPLTCWLHWMATIQKQ